MRKFLFIIIVLAVIIGLEGEPISAVWVLPWDLVREGSIDTVLVNLQANGQNTLLAEVRYRADAIYYPNKRDNAYLNLDPRSYIMKDSNFDALEYLLQEAKKYNIKVHAWITVLVVTPHDLTKLPLDHIYYKHSNWITTDLAGEPMPLNSAEGYFLDPGLKQVQTYTLNVINDLLLNYPQLAGLHLDYVRYPGEDYGYHPEAMIDFEKKHIPNTYSNRMLWKEEVLTNFVETIYMRVKELNPRLEVSVAVVADKVKARGKYSQNWQTWLEKGIVDKVYLMAYTKEDRILIQQLEDPELVLHKDKVVVGLRAWDNNKKEYSVKQITSKINLSRKLGYKDFSLFSYGGIMENNYWTNLKEEFVQVNKSERQNKREDYER
ncbi:MAG: family 10 glycosylhydrolase [Bacteroidales bacterium]